MKKLCTVVLFLVMTALGGAVAQITVTNATFPVAGDTLKIATDIDPDGVVITQAGGPFNWDFTGLAVSFEDTVVFRPSSEGSAFASFPGAELMVDNGIGTEVYFNVTNTTFENMGAKGPDPAGVGLLSVLKFIPPVPERHAPLTFPSTFNSQSSLALAFSTAAIPGDLLDSLGLPFVPDSIRVRFSSNRNDFVDAYGKLAIPGGTYDVLREKRTDYRETRLDIKLPFIGWQDVTDLLLGNFGNLGKDTVITYHFFNDTVKEPIAVVFMDSTGQVAQQVEFKNNGVLSKTTTPATAAQKVSLFPNPVTGDAKLEYEHFVSGSYTLQVFDESGKMVLVKKTQWSSSGNENLSFSFLADGRYFYRIMDGYNNLIATGKFLKINR